MNDDVAFQISTKVINTLIVVFIISLVYLVFRFWIKSMELETKSKYKKRFWYASGIILVYFVGKIWMEGFIHLFAFLGIISAALTITQKETLMNFVGWFIIMWRDHFTEGDRIEIGSYKGYVHSIGFFYFTLCDEFVHHRHTPTGKTFRIPNGLVITSPLTNHLRKAQMIEYKMIYLITQNSSIIEAMNLIKTTVDQVVDSVYQKGEEKEKKTHHVPASSVYIKPKFDEPSGIEVNLCYFCYPKDQIDIEKKSYQLILEALQSSDSIELAFAPTHRFILHKELDFESLQSHKLVDFQKSVKK